MCHVRVTMYISPFNTIVPYDPTVDKNLLPRKDTHYTRSICRGNIVLIVLECVFFIPLIHDRINIVKVLVSSSLYPTIQ